MSTPHYLTITDTDEGRTTSWPHPEDCPDGDQCDILRRIHYMGVHSVATLGEGRPVGRYLLGRWHFHSLVLVDRDGSILPDPPLQAEISRGGRLCPR